MSELLITVISLVGGAVLASVSGIIVTCCVDSRKERKELEGFKLEFRLAIVKLYNRLEFFDENKDYGDLSWWNEYRDIHFLTDEILFDYRCINKIIKININEYYDVISKLKEIDIALDRPKISPIKNIRTGQIIGTSIDTVAWDKLSEFMLDDLEKLNKIKESIL